MTDDYGTVTCPGDPYLCCSAEYSGEDYVGGASCALSAYHNIAE